MKEAEYMYHSQGEPSLLRFATFLADQMCLKLHSVSVQLPRALPGCKTPWL